MNDLEDKMGDTITVVDFHKQDIGMLKVDLTRSLTKLDDHSRRGNIMISGLAEQFKDLNLGPCASREPMESQAIIL